MATKKSTTKQAVQFELLNTRTLAQGKYHTAIVPIGSCESHGDHLPFGMDALTAHALALRVGAKLGHTFVLPPTFFGMSHHYRHKPMTITLSSDTTTAMFRDIFQSLADWKIRNVFVLNGHDGNIPCWETAARDIKIAHPAVNIAGVDWWVPLGQLLPPDFFEVWKGWGHGGEAETSMGLELFPQFCDMAHARGMVPDNDSAIKEIWLFEELTKYGAPGAPKKATPAKGKRMADAVVDYIANYIERMQKRASKSGLKYHSQEA
jgi:creatinine amidohydrolase